jgi:hypothetical protein
MNENQEYKVIHNTVSTLAVMCAGDITKIIDLLTGYLWDEKEAVSIKHAYDKIVSPDDGIDDEHDGDRSDKQPY